ncbi:fatty acid synthase subunit beta [Fonsecaea monophora]|uniref:Fatty acid synthase subunit beta n=1 Tax=Fonsecaea monophora TaxID=254056 RepID=A0A177EY27_9EURO|nr:fatty acid synthase subunit beta [Fonsecaea monophora]OAG36858.1 fatty acid synthase subunit beta [Fonsecaea monophora]
MFHFSAGPPSDEPSLLHGSKPTPNQAKPEKRQITRNRASYSCLTCRRRKVKCDKARPICGGCQKADVECFYTQDDTTSTSAQPDLPKETTSPVWKKRKSSPTSQGSLGTIAEVHGLRTPADLKAIEEQLHRLTKMFDAFRQGNGNDLRLKDFLTPEASNSDSGSDGIPPKSSMSLDMFQPSNYASAREPSDLSKPLSSLNLSSGESRSEYPFWINISEEIDQLNHLMRRRDNTYASSISPENKHCDRPREFVPPVDEDHEQEKDDVTDPTDFHKEAGEKIPEDLRPDSHCPICRLMPFTKSSLLQNLPVKCTAETALQHLTQGLPTRAQSNVLFRCWLSGVYPILGLLLPSEMSRKHEEFWDQVESNGLSESNFRDLDFLAVIYAIWYAGSLSISTKGLRQWFPQTSRAQLSTRFHDQVVFCLLISCFAQKVSLYKLAALVLLQSMPIAEEDPLQGSLYLSLAVRLAFTMGLHREPTLFELSITEENMRRRLWWQIIQLDVSHVVASGYPSQISEKFCDTRIICEDRDAHVSEDGSASVNSDKSLRISPSSSSASNGESTNPKAFGTLSLVARGKSIMACAIRSVVSLHLETKRLTNGDMQEMKRIMTEAGDQVNAIIKSIPSKGVPEMGFVPDSLRDAQQRPSDTDVSMGDPITANDIAYYKTTVNNTDPSWPLAAYYRAKQAAYNKWARISLSMLIDKVHCVAYAPFLKNTRSKLWGMGRQCALHNCHSFLRKFVSLAADPDLEPFRWAWPATYGPLHAVLIVLVDLYERPTSVEAPRSRELIDKVFGLAAPGAGIVGGPDGATVQRPLREGGIEAWDMLRGLRSAAWQRAGLDPTVLWTEADQIELGIAQPLTDAQRIAQSIREDSIYDSPTPGPQTSPSCTRDAQAEHPALEQGVRYMVHLAHKELVNENHEAQEPICSQAMRSQLRQTLENESGSNGGRVLARREGQPRMPFPLSKRMEKCSGTAATSDTTPVHVLPFHTHTPRAEAQPPLCPTQAVPFLGGSEAKNGTQTVQQESAPLQHNWGEVPAKDVTDTEQKLFNAQLSKQQTMEASYGNNNVIGYSTGPLDHHDEESHRDQSFVYTELHQGDTEMNMGFDWERWDSVFGQYSGFTDLMEDATEWSDSITLMERTDNQTTHEPHKNLFDYSNVITFTAGKGSHQQYFAFDGPRLCRESTYFADRLHEDYPEARSRHFDFGDIKPAVLACMLSWYRGWSCVSCDEDSSHVNEALSLAEKCRIVRFEEHLVQKTKTRTSALGLEKAQSDYRLSLCGDDVATELEPALPQWETKDPTDGDDASHSLCGRGTTAL